LNVILDARKKWICVLLIPINPLIMRRHIFPYLLLNRLQMSDNKGKSGMTAQWIGQAVSVLHLGHTPQWFYNGGLALRVT
jgi:hypothetical protein